MPSVIDTPERIEYVETDKLTPRTTTIERLQPRRIRPGFWRMLVHGITKHLTYMPYERHASTCWASRPFETPMDRLVRKHPSLSVYALAII